MNLVDFHALFRITRLNTRLLAKVLFDKKEFYIVSVPSPVLSADQHRDSVNENGDIVENDEGNKFSITILSSNVGVDWQIDIQAKGDEEDFRKRIDVEYQANEF